MELFTSDTERIDQVITLLFQKCDRLEYEKMCAILDHAYLNEDGSLKENFRHRYSSVSGKLNELKNSRRDFVDQYGLASVTGNAEGLYAYAKDENKPYVNNLFKLLDHIGLEIARIDYKSEIWDKIQENSTYSEKLSAEYEKSWKAIEGIQQMYQRASDNTDKSLKLIQDTSDRMQQKEKEISEKEKEVSEKVKKANKLLQNTKKKVESLQKDYITVLGILASILITFTSGSIFSSSVLANIHQSSRYRISFICIVLGFILCNTVAFLMLFIKWIVQAEKEAFSLPMMLIKVDKALIALMFFIVIAWFFDLGKLAENVQDCLYR